MNTISTNNAKLGHGLINKGFRLSKEDKSHCVVLIKGKITIKLFKKSN